MISESGSVEAMLRSPGFPAFSAATIDHQRLDRLDPMQNQMCRVCEEPAAGFHFGAFTCEGCKSFFGRTCNNQSVIQECKNNYRCVVDKKNRTACKACRLRKCLMVGMSKSGSRYGRRSNWFKIHCLMQQSLGHQKGPKTGSAGSSTTEVSPLSNPSSLSPTSPPRTWPSSKDLPREHSPKMMSSLTSDPDRKSPDLSPTMVPRTSSIGATPSPFASLLPQPPPVSPPALKLATSEASVAAAATAAAQQSLASLSPLYAAGFPPTFPLMSTPGFHNLPFHKQALLSPLLAHTHLWHMARSAASSPLLNAQRPAELDLMAEHKALMERFAAAAMAAQAAASAQAASSKEDQRPKSTTPPPSSAASSPKNLNNNNNAVEPQNAPMDLSNKRSSDEEEEDSAEEDSELKQPALKKLKHHSVRSDLNRNVVMHHQGPSGSEADDEEVDQEDEEELDVGENLIR